jgi:hypothetical protein
MGESEYCYWHHKARERAEESPQQRKSSNAAFELPLLDDASSIQVAIQQVLSALANRRIDAFRAKAFLYGLQLATVNVRNLQHIRLTKDKVAGCLFWADGKCSFPDPEMRAKGECTRCPVREYIYEEVKKNGGIDLIRS